MTCRAACGRSRWRAWSGPRTPTGAIVWPNLQPGTYTLCEVDMPAGWHSSLEQVANAVVTKDAAGNVVSVCIEVTIGVGQTVTI